MNQQSIPVSQVAAVAPPKQIKPPKLSNGHVLCLKKGTAADLGRHVPPNSVFVSLYRATDLTCATTCGGRCVPSGR